MMPEENRRMFDDRLFRVEEQVSEIDAKISNGLTERGKRTEAMVVELNDRHDQFEKAFLHHIHAEEIERHEMTNVLDSVGQSITMLAVAQEKLAKTQEGWVKAKNRVLGIIIGSLLTSIGFILMHLNEINALMAHVMEIH